MKANLLAALCLLCWAPSALAEPVTLEQCLQRAEKGSVLKFFQLASEAAVESLNISRASFYPTLKLKASYSLVDNAERLIIRGNSFGNGIPAEDVTLRTGDRDTYNVGVHLQQPLFTGGSLTQRRRRAELQVEAARSDLTFQRSETSRQVKKAFNEALASRLQVRARLKALAGPAEQARVVRERLAEGRARQEDLMLAEMEVYRAQAVMAREENQTELSLATLRKLIDAAPDEPIEPVGQLLKVRLSAPLGELQSLGLKKRADLESGQTRVQTGSTEVAIARSGFFPQVSLVGSYLRQPVTAITLSEVWTVGAQAEWNLFEWGQTSAEVRRAAAAAQQETMRQNEARKEVLFEIEELWRGFKDEESLMREAETRLKTLEYQLAKVQERHREGVVKRADVQLAEAVMWSAYADYVKNAAAMNSTVAGLERATGGDLSPWLEFAPLHVPGALPPAQQRKSETQAQPASAVSAAVRPAADRAAVYQPAAVAPSSAAVRPATLSPAKPAAAGAGAVGSEVKQVYQVQVGAYKSRENALRVLNSLKAKIGSAPLTMIRQAGLYKVQAGPFRQKEEAVQAAAGLGVKEYLVKVSHGP